MRELYIAYVLNERDLSIKDVLQFENYTFMENSTFEDKSSFETLKRPNIEKRDFVICMKNDKVVYTGICTDFNSSDNSAYTITMSQMENMFDTDIMLNGEHLIRDTGIEDFIVQMIKVNWITDGDPLLDKPFLNPVARTHTRLNIRVNEDDDEIFNLKEFIVRALESYGVQLIFSFNKDHTRLDIDVSKIAEESYSIDMRVSDVIAYSEIYTEEILSRVLIKVQEEDDPGTAYVAPFFYLSNGQVSQNIRDSRRVYGTSKSLFIELKADSTTEDVRQLAVDAFNDNKYEHKVVASVLNDSKLYEVRDLFLGKQVTIMTKTGLTDSIITGIEYSSETNSTNLTFGRMRTSLIEKLRRKK